MANKDYRKRLKKAIRDLHGVGATWVATTPVHEVFNGQTVWMGDVEMFILTGHPKTDTCYAWSYFEGENNETEQFVAVLKIPPVESPEAAVKVAMGHAVREARSINKASLN